MRLVSLTLLVQSGAAPTHDRKRRSVLKRVEVATDDGETKALTVANTMRAIVAWLDSMNKEHASAYSVDRLVWCEEQSSARSEKGTIRGWFKVLRRGFTLGGARFGRHLLKFLRL